MPWGVAAAAVGSVASSAIGGAMSGGAAQTAAGQQVQAADQAGQVQRDMFNQTQRNLAPWMNIGAEGANALRYFSGIAGFGQPDGPNNFGGVENSPLFRKATYGDYQASPFYQAMIEGQNRGTSALLNNASRMGGPLSGNTLLALQQYGQGSAMQGFGAFENDYTSWQQRMYQMLSGISGSGQNAAANLGGFGANAAGNIGDAMINAGNANAAGTIGASNAWGGALNGLTNTASNYMNFNKLFSDSGSRSSMYPGSASYGDGIYSGSGYSSAGVMPLGSI